MPVLDCGSVKFETVLVRRGEFVMGSHNDPYGETPRRGVVFASDFWLGACPVTQSQWMAVTGANPSTFSDDPERPVDNVSWLDAHDFCRRLSVRSGRRVHLPSESQWEYACRAGTKADYFFRSGGSYLDETAVPPDLIRELDDFAWFDLNSCDTTHPVGGKRPNPWGLHDMLGNVWEWCEDVWHASYERAPCDGGPMREGEERRRRRCLRGGAWDMNAFRCRSSYRSYDHLDLATNRFGLRIAVD